MKNVFRLILGWFLIAVGIAGLFLPIVQGIPLIIIGLYILSRHYTWAKRLFNKFRNRFPTMANKIDELKGKQVQWLRNLFKRNKI